jgi:hypothetical protein
LAAQAIHVPTRDEAVHNHINIDTSSSPSDIERQTCGVRNFPFLGCLFFFFAGVEPSPLLLRPFTGLLYQPWMTDGDDCGAISGMNE